MGLFDRLRRAFSGEPEEEPKKEDEIVSTSEENQEPERSEEHTSELQSQR